MSSNKPGESQAKLYDYSQSDGVYRDGADAGTIAGCVSTQSRKKHMNNRTEWQETEPGSGIKQNSKAPAGKVSTTGVPLIVIGFLIGMLVIFAGIFAFGLFPRLAQHQEATATAAKNTATPVYAATAATLGKAELELSLPANIQAIQEFSIYSRCDGYLERRLVDIGDRVRKGQLLMEVDAPELEKQLKRANADYKEAQAQLKSAQADLAQSLSVVETNKAAVKRLEAQIRFSTAELKRYQSLATDGAVSLEMRDEKLRDLKTDEASLEAAHAAVAAATAQAAANREKISAARANVEATLASVEEIQTTTSWQKVLAPCDGVITARNVDAGALVSKGSSTNNQELLKMARTDTLRVFVYIPQTDYHNVFVGMPAKITVSELPNHVFSGTITHISGGLDPTSRTLQTEIHIPNHSSKLMPGMFAQVKLITHREHRPVLVPDSALIVQPEGRFVVTVSPQGSAHLQEIKLGRDFGKKSEVLSGLQPGEKVLTQPPSDIEEGQHIRIEIESPAKEG